MKKIASVSIIILICVLIFVYWKKNSSNNSNILNEEAHDIVSNISEGTENIRNEI